MSNFDFLKTYSRKMARAGEHAEKILYISPEACITVLRTIAESIATDTVQKLNLRPATNDKGDSSFHQNLIAIQASKVAPRMIMDKFFDIKNNGNNSAHGFYGAPEDAKELLQSTYDIAAWFMREIKRSRDPIPPFVIPEPPVDESSVSSTTIPPPSYDPKPTSAWERLFASRAGKWISGILAALGLTFIIQCVTHKEHRWDVALRNTLRFAVFVVVIALLAVPFFVVANGLTMWQAYHLFVGSISNMLGWNEYLIDSMGLVLLVPFICSVRLTFSKVSLRRWTGIAALLALAIGYNLMFYYATKDTPFMFGSGHGVKYYARTDQGIVIYDRSGFDITTGQPLLQITPEIWREYQIQLEHGAESMVSVDPATHDWFNFNTDAPMLWYSRSSEDKLEFFVRSGYNPRTGDKLLPVTHELKQSWDDARIPKAPKPVTPQDELRAYLSPAASVGPGVLLLRETANDRSGAEALTRHLSGVNTSAFRAEALEQRGLATKFYQGDAVLVRNALSITHLNSLVVAEVKFECAKRSPLDADLLSCDLTADARKFDVHGNLAGSQRVQSTGAGFNQDAALDVAAQRASSSLAALAKH